MQSPPAWVAWIEIAYRWCDPSMLRGRHPHGWRGLKYPCDDCVAENRGVATRMGGVD